jgi:hypothetical protein
MIIVANNWRALVLLSDSNTCIGTASNCYGTVGFGGEELVLLCSDHAMSCIFRPITKSMSPMFSALNRDFRYIFSVNLNINFY